MYICLDPFSNYEFFILDDLQQQVPVGSVGELYIGGLGVSAGYWRRLDLSEKSHLILSQYSTSTIYRTGDLVKLDNEGFVHYLGRADFQVKLRGKITNMSFITYRTEILYYIDCLILR